MITIAIAVKNCETNKIQMMILIRTIDLVGSENGKHWFVGNSLTNVLYNIVTETAML